jgi:hypothetical protein
MLPIRRVAWGGTLGKAGMLLSAPGTEGLKSQQERWREQNRFKMNICKADPQILVMCWMWRIMMSRYLC